MGTGDMEDPHPAGSRASSFDRPGRTTAPSGFVRAGSGPCCVRSTDLSDPSEAALPDLAVNEELIDSLRGIGATMFLTTDRLIVARDGPDRRPRSGVQSFPLERVTHVRLEPGALPSGRIAIRIGGQEAVSMFFDARSRDRAQQAVERARTLIARRRRDRTAARRTTGR